MAKLAIKRLTGSDLTFFEWQFRNRLAGNQKSINLNANVFIDELYPSLTETDQGRTGRISIDLNLYGPGHARALNLQRKIIKGGSYKNWRLNGEYVSNPIESPNRFDVLTPGDFVIFDFEGDLSPTAARAVFVAKDVLADANLHKGIDDHGVASMLAIDMPALRLIVHASGTPESHPVYELLLDAAIEDAALGGLEGTRRLLSRTTGRKLTRSELERARQRADDVGRAGEELIDGFFELGKFDGTYTDYVWVADDNAVSPFDFTVIATDQPLTKVEVKSTNGDFNQVLHFSIAQLLEMRDGAAPYHVYRVYELDELTAKLRIASDLRPFAEQVLSRFDRLPTGVTVDGISVRPDSLPFGAETVIELPRAGELFSV